MSVKVSIYKSPWNAGLDITIWEERDGRIFICKPMQMEMTEAKEGCFEQPTLRIQHFLAPEFMKALAEALDNNGIKTDSDAKMQGTLEATRDHLRDLKKLLKLEK